jgi:hypothetical protein
VVVVEELDVVVVVVSFFAGVSLVVPVCGLVWALAAVNAERANTTVRDLNVVFMLLMIFLQDKVYVVKGRF